MAETDHSFALKTKHSRARHSDHVVARKIATHYRNPEAGGGPGGGRGTGYIEELFQGWKYIYVDEKREVKKISFFRN